MMYFGCKGNPMGHYLWLPNGGQVNRREEANLPVRLGVLDAGLLPDLDNREQGDCVLNVINGWTILSFVDRSGDSRPGSNSSFLTEGEWSFTEMVAMARRDFPDVFSRRGFPLLKITLVEEE